jgi:small multidrug resistance family-3 protein
MTPCNRDWGMTIIRSLLLFVAAALAEIGGAWLVWQGVREHRGLIWIGAGVATLGLYGFVATLQPDAHFGRILAAYGGIFVAGSLAWGMIVDKFRPDRYDLAGSVICLFGVALSSCTPRALDSGVRSSVAVVVLVHHSVTPAARDHPPVHRCR